MEEMKQWYLSKTVWGALVAIFASLLPGMGIELGADARGQLADNLVSLAGAVGGLIAIYGRLTAMTGRAVPAGERPLLEDLGDQFERVASLSDGEKEFLFGVIDLYQTRVATRMTVAVERLAVLAAVTLPVTAVASVYGMNVIVNQQTHVPQLLLVLTLMVAMSAALLRWTKRQGWW